MKGVYETLEFGSPEEIGTGVRECPFSVFYSQKFVRSC